MMPIDPLGYIEALLFENPPFQLLGSLRMEACPLPCAAPAACRVRSHATRHYLQFYGLYLVIKA